VEEGCVVIVPQKVLDDRVRQAENEAKGTVVFVNGNMIWVLLTNGDFWIGPSFQAYADQH